MSNRFSLFENCDMKPFPQKCGNFSCGDSDLDDFFLNEAHNFEGQLLGKTFCFVEKEKTENIVCAFTLANASVKNKEIPDEAKKVLRKNFPRPKRARKEYPAVLLGRIGVSQKYCRRGIGTQVLDMLKQYFRYEIKSACRFLVVDAYNNDDTLRFYENNGFLFVFPEEEDEKKFLKKNALETRLMVFDLISV